MCSNIHICQPDVLDPNHGIFLGPDLTHALFSKIYGIQYL